MSSAEEMSVLERRDRAIGRLDEGHHALKRSLEGLETEDAFLGSRWSVREVLLHLDSENFIDALEKIATGEQEMLPSFSTRVDQLKKELARLEETHQRFRALVLGVHPLPRVFVTRPNRNVIGAARDGPVQTVDCPFRDSHCAIYQVWHQASK